MSKIPATGSPIARYAGRCAVWTMPPAPTITIGRGRDGLGQACGNGVMPAHLPAQRRFWLRLSSHTPPRNVRLPVTCARNCVLFLRAAVGVGTGVRYLDQRRSGMKRLCILWMVLLTTL